MKIARLSANATRRMAILSLFLTAFALFGCGKGSTRSTEEHEILASQSHFQAVSTQGLDFRHERQVFVPVYTHLRTDEGSIPLTINLTIHNTDFESLIYVTSVRYYTHSGKLVREYLDETHSLEAMGSAEFILRPQRPISESALNFIVEWKAETQVNEPVVEAVMGGTFGTHALSFVTTGRHLPQLSQQ